MFKLIALVFLLTNGVPSEKPVAIFTFKELTSFPSAKECLAYVDTEEGKAMFESAGQFLIATQRRPLAMQPTCIDGSKADNGSI